MQDSTLHTLLSTGELHPDLPITPIKVSLGARLITGDYTSTDWRLGWANQYTEQVACGGYGNGENLDTWDVQEGRTITATWNQWPEGHHGESG